MAEREGFEPSVRSPPRSLSKGVLSTTQPSLHDSVISVARLIHRIHAARQPLAEIFLIIFSLARIMLFACLIFFLCLTHFVMRKLTLAIFLVLLSACAKEPKKEEEVKKKPKTETTQLVARVQSRPGGKDFVLLEAYGKWTYADGVTLYSYGEGGRTAALVTSGEKLGQFVAADLKSGTVEIGDAVYHRPQRINEENPQADEVASTPAAPSAPPTDANAAVIEPVPESLAPVDGNRGNAAKPSLPKW